MGAGVHFHTGRQPENIGARAICWVRGRMANLHEEMAVTLELQNLTIAGAGPTNPNAVILIHVNSMLTFWPIKSFAGTSPRLQQVSLGIKDEDGRSGEAALRLRRSLRSAQLIDRV